VVIIKKYNEIMEAKRKIKVKLYKTITIRKVQKEEDDTRVMWRSEPRGGGWTDGDSLAGALQYTTADAEEAREKRRREAREEEQMQAVPDLSIIISDMEPFPGASIPLY
jgi:hypothetical protein